MSRKNLAMAAFFTLVMASIGVLASCVNERPATSNSPETVSGVAVVIAKKTMVPDFLEAVGTVRAVQTSQVSSQMTGNIVEIRAHEGDRVQSGQVLAVIDDAQPRSTQDQASAALAAANQQVSAAESDAALAAATLQRYQQLYDKKSVSPQEFDEIKARYQSASARRDMARADAAQAEAAVAHTRTSLGYARIRAPFAGVVTERTGDAGTLASPGMPIFTVEDTRNYWLEATVDESEIRLVQIGQPVTVLIDSLGLRERSGKVAQIVPAADPLSRTFLVKIALPADAGLRSGLFGRARFARGERSALLIPRGSLVERGQLQGIYVLDETQIAGLRYVTLGRRTGDEIEVLSGLQGGEKLIAEPGDRDFGGKRIALRP